VDKRTEAKKFLKSLEAVPYAMKKIAAKDDAPFMLTWTYSGRLEVFDLYDLETTDFRVRIHCDNGEILTTTPVIDAGRTPEGVILIETRNSIYRLERA
jgi:hypothetical protein